MRRLIFVKFADAGAKTGTHRVLVVGGCSDATAAADIGISLEEAKTLLRALQRGIRCGAVIYGEAPTEKGGV